MSEQQQTTELSKVTPASEQAMVQIGASRAAHEVQAAIAVAKRFPRDETDVLARIKRSCQRKSLAEVSQYHYPKGDKIIEGPSIRLAEELVRAWGNMDFGIHEIEQNQGQSTMLAYAWDFESNTRQTRVFTVKHERHTRERNYAIHDPRDIYEHTMNFGARRMRACILGLIPEDIKQAACDECDRTLASGHDKPLPDRIRDMAATFKANFNVTREMLETRLGHNLDATTEHELITLRKIYVSLRDGMANTAAYFHRPEKEGEKLIDVMRAATETPPPDAAAEPEPEPDAPAEEPQPEIEPEPKPPTARKEKAKPKKGPPMKDAALRCPHCDSTATWRRDLNGPNCPNCEKPGVEVTE